MGHPADHRGAGDSLPGAGRAAPRPGRSLAIPEQRQHELLERFHRLHALQPVGLPIECGKSSSPPTTCCWGQPRLMDGRRQPFSLILRSLEGRLMVRCVSPVGCLEDGFEEKVGERTRNRPVQVGVVWDDRFKTYNANVEGEVLLGPPLADANRVAAPSTGWCPWPTSWSASCCRGQTRPWRPSKTRSPRSPPMPTTDWRNLTREPDLDVQGDTISVRLEGERGQQVFVEDANPTLLRVWSVAARPAMLQQLEEGPDLYAWGATGSATWSGSRQTAAVGRSARPGCSRRAWTRTSGRSTSGRWRWPATEWSTC